MNLYISDNHNPYFNLATEEFFLKSSDLDIFMIYTNDTSIVVGKHQNALSEINSVYAYKNGIKIARRLSGGGTVFHDAGNINFSFITTVSGSDMINYQRFAAPIRDSLRLLGMDVQFSKRNDLIINDMKISGSAMHVFKNRVLAHGTLLFDADLAKLSQSLKSNQQKYTDKSIKSVRSKVVNLHDYLPKMDVNGLIEHLINTVGKDNSIINLNNIDKSIIINQVEEKYLSYDWVFGYSPKYQFSTSINIGGIKTEVNLFVEKGLIQKVEFNASGEINKSIKLFFNHLIENKHEINSLLSDTELLQIIDLIPDYPREKFCADFF